MPLAITENEVETIVPVVAIFFIFGFPVLAWLIHRSLAFRERQLKYAERIEMIKHGINPDAASTTTQAATPPNEWQQWSGAPQSQAEWRSWSGLPPTPALQKELSGGLILAAIGLAITVGLSFIGMGPWLIGGLIPLFIGLVRVMMALSSGAQMRFGPLPPQAPRPPPPQNFAERPTTPPTYEGSYTYRPGSTQELKPPTPPPANRE